MLHRPKHKRIGLTHISPSQSWSIAFSKIVGSLTLNLKMVSRFVVIVTKRLTINGDHTMHSELGTRMKSNYEDRCRPYLTRRVPVIVRVDGRAFHTITRKADKPFDYRIVGAMLDAAMGLTHEMQGFKAGYVQSDEASFLLMDDDTIQTEAWFDYNQQKLVSISASLMTALFNRSKNWMEYMDAIGLGLSTTPIFDARAFSIPATDVANYFLWRAKDWERNSISMYARSFFSAKQLHGKNRNAVLTMLEAEGHRWNEIPGQFRNGSWLNRWGGGGVEMGTTTLPNYDSVSSWLDRIFQENNL